MFYDFCFKEFKMFVTANLLQYYIDFKKTIFNVNKFCATLNFFVECIFRMLSNRLKN